VAASALAFCGRLAQASAQALASVAAGFLPISWRKAQRKEQSLREIRWRVA